VDGSGADPKAIVTSIDMVVYSETVGDTFEQELVADLLFRSNMPPSLFKFLDGSVRSKDKPIVQAKLSIMKFIAAYVKYSGGSIAAGGVAGAVFAHSYDLYRREESREFKATCLLPIKKLLSAAIRDRGVGAASSWFSIPVESGELGSLITHLLEELGASKQSKGGRCEILKVLGLLVRLYPDTEVVANAVPRVQDACDRLLAASFSSSSGAEPDFLAIAGCFSCLDHCMFDFEARYASSTKSAQLWGWLLQAVSSVRAEDTHRYAIAGKALRLIENHAAIFRPIVAGNIRATYEQIEVGSMSVVRWLFRCVVCRHLIFITLITCRPVCGRKRRA